MEEKSIIPGILTDDMVEMQEKLDKVSEFSTKVSIDVVDGLFADNLTVMPESFSELEFYNLAVDVQLMVVEPVEYLGYLHGKIERVFGHIERMGDINGFLDECERLSIKSGLGLDLYTPIDSIDKTYLKRTSGVLLMAVEAGFSGQEYSDITKKVKELREGGYERDIVVDGGMNMETIPKLLAVGANQFSVTSDIWNYEDLGLRYKQLVDLLKT